MRSPLPPAVPDDKDDEPILCSLPCKGANQEAQERINSAIKEGLDSAELRIALFETDLLLGTPLPTLRDSTWLKEDAGEDAVLNEEASFAACSGKLMTARERWHQLAASKLKRGLKESAGTVDGDLAVVEAEFGDYEQARMDIAAALMHARKPNVLVDAVLVYAFTGQSGPATTAMNELQTRFPYDNLQNEAWFPTGEAIPEIQNGNVKHALELLESSKPYELGQAVEFLPIYVRGSAYIREKDGTNAVNEFRKIIDHRGVSATWHIWGWRVL